MPYRTVVLISENIVLTAYLVQEEIQIQMIILWPKWSEIILF